MTDNALSYSTTDPGFNEPLEKSARIIDPRSLVGNALWNVAKTSASDIWKNVIKPPGEILAGERSPYSMDIPQYAADLALTGFGIRGANALTRGGAFDPQPNVLTHFPAWHGSASNQPFIEFDPDFIGTGEGSAYRGHGFYVGQAQGTGERYRQIAAGSGKVLLGEDGAPLQDYEVAQKFYEPGTIVPAGGEFHRVESFHPGPERSPWNWSVSTRRVNLIPELAGERYGEGFTTRYTRTGMIPGDAVNHPELWSDLYAGGPQKNVLQNHATYPLSREIESLAAARGAENGWRIGDPGGLLHINVKPEEHEFFDLDLPWKKQEPAVQEKLINAKLSPYEFSEWWAPNEMEDVTGEELRKELVRREAQPYIGGDHISFDEAARRVSELFDAAGVPGNKFLDQQSRHKLPSVELSHPNIDSAPDPNLARHYIEGYPSFGNTRDEAVNAVTHQLETRIRHDTGDLISQGGFLTQPTKDRLNTVISNHRDLLDWVNNERENFRMKDSRTRNFVVFNPKNLEIKTWNGIPLEPVEGDPFARTLTPVAGDPFDVRRP